jgi:hypothetical protein
VAEKHRELAQAQVHAIGGLQLVACHHVRHHGRARRDAERRGQADAQRQRIHHPQRQAARQHQGSQHGQQRQVDVLGDHQHLLGRVAVHQRTADQDEQRARHADECQHGAQHQRVAGHLQHQPGQGDQRELVAQHREERAAGQPAEVAVLEKRGALVRACRGGLGVLRTRRRVLAVGVFSGHGQVLQGRGGDGGGR